MKTCKSALCRIVAAVILCSVTFAGSEEVLVQRVIDGDTFIGTNGKTYRLLGIDTPETKHPRKGIEPYGPEASEATNHFISGKQVLAIYDPKASERDRYGRELVRVEVGGSDLGLVLVSLGLAKVERRFPLSEIYLIKLDSTELIARRNCIGVWSGFTSKAKDTSIEDICSRLFNSQVVAADGQNLGVLADSHHPDSIFNPQGYYGSSTGVCSIWNERGLYGGSYGIYSPFNPECEQAPRIIKDGNDIGALSVNSNIQGSVNPMKLRDLCRW